MHSEIDSLYARSILRICAFCTKFVQNAWISWKFRGVFWLWERKMNPLCTKSVQNTCSLLKLCPECTNFVEILSKMQKFCKNSAQNGQILWKFCSKCTNFEKILCIMHKFWRNSAQNAFIPRKICTKASAFAQNLCKKTRILHKVCANWTRPIWPSPDSRTYPPAHPTQATKIMPIHYGTDSATQSVSAQARTPVTHFQWKRRGISAVWEEKLWCESFVGEENCEQRVNSLAFPLTSLVLSLIPYTILLILVYPFISKE